MDYLLHHFRRISDMDMGDSSKGGWGMSKFKVGDKVRRVKHTTGLVYQCPIGFEAVVSGEYSPKSDGFWYVNNCGHLVHTRAPDDWELIEPAHQGPVRTATTTRKEIAPGKHGPLTVSDYPSYRRVKIQVELAIMDKSQLYSLAADIKAMGDALESGE